MNAKRMRNRVVAAMSNFNLERARVKQREFDAEQERKRIERERWLEYANKHPVSSGPIPMTDYVAPAGNYSSAYWDQP